MTAMRIYSESGRHDVPLPATGFPLEFPRARRPVLMGTRQAASEEA
jgi:hypothetical protein